MTRRIVFAALPLMFAAAAAAQTAPKVPLNKVPAEAIKAAQDRFPDADIQWAKKEDLNGAATFRVKFRDASKAERYVGITADGKLLYTEEKAKEADLPVGIRAAIQTEFGGSRIADVRKVTGADGAVTYRLDTGQGKAKDRARLDSAGAIVSLRNGNAGGVDAKLGRFFTGRGFEEKSWEAWLSLVDKTVKMTDDQRTKATALLGEAKDAAVGYRKAKEEDYKRIAAELAALRAEAKPDPAKKKSVEKAAADLSAPVDEITKKWKADVLALLTDEQRKVAPR